MTLAAMPPVTEFDGRAQVRLIPDSHHKPPVLSPLVDDEEEMAILVRFEARTNRRIAAEESGLPGLDRRELAFRRRADGLAAYGLTHVNAAFAYTRAGGNRFNGEDRGAWYCAADHLTAIDEVGFHRTRELGFAGVYQDKARYRALIADIVGVFPDLRGQTTPALGEDPAQAYPAGQTLARALRSKGHDGLIYPSVRRKGGVCFAAFAPQIVQNVRPGAAWEMSWAGGPEYAVTAH